MKEAVLIQWFWKADPRKLGELKVSANSRNAMEYFRKGGQAYQSFLIEISWV